MSMYDKSTKEPGGGEEKAHKKNIKTVCGNIIGAVIIAFGLIGCMAQVVYGIGMILLGLLLISPVRNKITSSLKLKNKWIYLIWVIVSLLIMFVGIGLTPDSEPNEASSEPEIIDIESVDVLFESDDYINKTVRVKGSVNYEDVSTGDMKMYGEYSDAEVYLQGSEKYEMPESECATVTGVVKLDEYDIPTITVKKFKPCTDENCSHNGLYCDMNENEEISFEEKIAACTRFSDMNWAEFYQYPDTYDDGEIYYLVGKVIWTDGSGGGLMQLVENDKRTTVQFTTSEGEHVYENELIAMFGTISGGGEYKDNNTDEVYSCPYFFAQECMRGDYEYSSAAELSEEEHDFIFGDYEILYGYASDDFGETIKLTEDTISGYPYTLKTLKLSYGSVLISSYDNLANNLKYMMVIDVDVDGESRSVIMFFRLDGQVEIDNHDCERVD